jgi:polyisoprenoid-binding protein YceI
MITASAKRLVLLTCVGLLAAVPAFAQTWQIDTAHSRAHFAVQHLGISDIRGDFGHVTGTVEFDGKDVTKARVNATIDVSSITTRVDKRDAHLKTADFFDVANHPTMTFVSTSIKPAGSGTYTMTGTLTLRGVTRPVTLELTQPAGPVTDNMGTTKMGASASGRINRKDFGVNYHQVLSNGALGVADMVDIHIDVELIAPKAGQTN